MINLLAVITIINIVLFVVNVALTNRRVSKCCDYKFRNYKIEILVDQDEIELLKKEADFINSHDNIISVSRETYDFPYYAYVSTIKYAKEI